MAIGFGGLAPDTEYTVKVVATRTVFLKPWHLIRTGDGSIVTTELAWAETTARTGSESVGETPVLAATGPTFTVYHDPEHSGEAASRDGTAKGGAPQRDGAPGSPPFRRHPFCPLGGGGEPLRDGARAAPNTRGRRMR